MDGPVNDAGRTARLERLEALAELLDTIASTLDIRAVFQRVSEITRRVLPHDTMGLALVDEDRVHGRLYAVSSDVDFERPEKVRLTDAEQVLLSGAERFEIVDDISGDPTWLERPPGRIGLRGMMRVGIHDGQGLEGGLGFFSRQPGAFTADDLPIAHRVAAYVTLALSHQRLAEAAARAAEARERAQRLERRVEDLTRQLATLSAAEHRIIGRAPAWRHVISEASRVAPTEATVLLTGESGTGKELVARLIHRESPRAKGPFVALNCAALPEPLLESELFGVERGAFTGATQSRAGRLEQASGGVLFLDEVGEMSPAVQVKLLRMLQEREFQRLGGQRTLRADVRIVAATNRDLRRLVQQGQFREDLYYRLNVFEVRLPPLRERPEDVLLLSASFLADAARTLGRPVSGLSADARPALLEYEWPGNVRELRNVIERAAILADGGLVTRAHLSLPGRAAAGRAEEGTAAAAQARMSSAAAALPGPVGREVRLAERQLVPTHSTMERELLVRALEAHRYNKSAAARTLGLSRMQLYTKLRRYGLE